MVTLLLILNAEEQRNDVTSTTIPHPQPSRKESPQSPHYKNNYLALKQPTIYSKNVCKLSYKTYGFIGQKKHINI